MPLKFFPKSVLGLLAVCLLPGGLWFSGAAQPSVLTPWDVARLQAVREAAIGEDGAAAAYLLEVPRDPLQQEDGPAWSELHMVRDGRSQAFVSGQVSVRRIEWVPGRNAVSFLAKRGRDEHTSLYLIPADGGEARRILSRKTDISDYSWSPDGKQVAFLASPEAGEKAKELRKKGFTAKVYEEDWKPVEIWISGVDPGAPEPRKLPLEGSPSSLEWSPSGDRLAVAVSPTPLIDDRYMRLRLTIVEAASGRVISRIENPGKLGEAAWSPDGQHLAFISAADLNDPMEGRLLVSSGEDGRFRDLVPGWAGHVRAIAWRDADTVAFLADSGVATSLEEVDLDGTRRVLIQPGVAAWNTLSVAASGAMALSGDNARHPAELFLWRPGGQPERATNSNPWLAEKRLAAQEVIRYPARDGLQLEGLLIRPLDQASDRRYPLILYVHGGPEAHLRDGWLTSYSAPGQVAAARGFAVFYPNYRGSTGRGVEFSKLGQGDPAGKEFDDLVDGVDYLIAQGLADPSRVGITGGSYGGYATAWGATYYSRRFAAAVMFVGISEKIAKFGTSDIPNELMLVHDLIWPWQKWQLMLERSPIYHVEKAQTPLLILHGEDDPRVHPSQSLMLYRYLKILNRTPVRLILYPGEGHGNRKAAARLDYHLRLLRWFEHYLKGPGGAPPDPDLDYQPVE